jgi:hypothetical protein
MPKRIVQTIIPNDGVFRFEANVRAEGAQRGLRVAIPAAIVRGLVHTGWTGRWLDVKLDDEQFKIAVRPHPTSVMFALPKRHRGTVQVGDRISLEIQKANGPHAPRARRIRGKWRKTAATLSLPWLR